jgi:asparagine synthase (glutamine-hydrolysing)
MAIVHRRLSIIDLAGGRQPMVSERGRNDGEGLVAVAFNGCIYNHRELRSELIGRGHRFATDHSDTEVLIHGHREWGDQLTRRLEGMYSYAIWDRAAGALTLARDWFGEKPLFYRLWPGSEDAATPFQVLAFASDPQCLWNVPRRVNGTDTRAITRWAIQYLQQGYVAANASPDGSVMMLPPGTAMRIDSHGRCTVVDSLDVARLTERASTTAGAMESLINRSVRQRLEADVPLACFLSGGVDSSLIATFAKRHNPALRTFSVRMPDPRYDESEFANRVAAHLGTDHATLDVSINPAEDLHHLITTMGQPFGDSSILPTHWVSRAAREHVKVALSGDGGDELFIGYERYMAARALARHWRLLRQLPRAMMSRSHPKGRWHKAGRLGEMARDFPTLGLGAMESLFTLQQLALLTDDEPSQFMHCEGGDDGLASLRWFDLWRYLPYDLLRKVDVASMCVSAPGGAGALEVRCPMLDRELAIAAIRAPVDQLMPGGQRKGLLRQIARKHLPAEIVDRPKMGFAIPIGEWFRSDDLPSRGCRMKTLLMDHLGAAQAFGPVELHRSGVRTLIDEHMSGKRDHGQRLFALLTLSMWVRTLKS